MAHRDDAVSRRKALGCMAWAGTGVLWTISGGVAHSLGLLAQATTPDQVTAPDAGALTFLQISDSHVGFAKPVNPNARATLEEAIGRIKTMPVKPSFVIHTGDITHFSKASEFDDAQHIISQAQLDVHYVPGEHDVLDPEVKLYLERFGLVNVATGGRFMGDVDVDNPGGQAGGLGMLGDAQLEWIEDDLRGRPASTPLVVFAHMPLWAVYPNWGWGTEDSARALGYMKRFGSVTVLNGHIHQVVQKVEGNVTFHTARSTAFPLPAPGTAPSPGPMKIPPDKLRTMIGSASVTFKQGEQRLAIVDAPLQG
jgi:3',5'-cyclic AMP phosphodiesterase CpdA